MTHLATGRVVFALAVTIGIGGHLETAQAKTPAQTHKVQKNEVLGTIARKTGCTVKQIKRANRLKSDLIKIGQILKLPSKCKGTARSSEGRTKPVVHIVVKGDTLSGLAKQYATSVKAIRKQNKLKGDILVECKKMKILPGKRVEERTKERHRIEAQDTLQRIARRYRTTVPEILCLNKKYKKDPNRIRIGDRLTVL
ncbi:MAG: LysM peptidoglycan-binding domain-containing protein, partial [Myxococcota bacterium]|nr:LysM peptidoglycan-binding domain-containing protein [Myxococcota bacterium]